MDHQVDALVVGAGFGGIYACYTLRKLGLRFACIENAGDVGGTWYWNRYPGAMSDTHSHMYRFSWDEEDFKTFPWSHNYVYQPEILSYLQHVVQKHDLRRFMQFNQALLSAQFDEQANVWRAVTSTGQVFIARYLITAVGLLSKPLFPDIAGINDYRGIRVHTSSWPEDLDLSDKRVALIGNGSTGVQVTSAIGPVAKSLTCFIRSPQYVVPSGRREVTPAQREDLNQSYSALWDQARKSAVAFGFDERTQLYAAATPEEREQKFQHLWNSGNGLYFMLGGYSDLTINPEANEGAASFIRKKISETVKDPETAKILTPYEYYARRPLCGSGYYETFNRDNVKAVDVKANPIAAITPGGIRLQDGTEHEVDVIIFATGFDAQDGNYITLDIRGRHGHSIREHWSKTVTSFGGTNLSQFPNMFMVLGPQSAFANNPPVLEAQVEFIGALIEHSEKLRTDQSDTYRGVVEVTQKTELEWAKACEEAAAGTLFPKIQSWIFGANVPGKVIGTRFYFPGLGKYRQVCEDLIAQGYKGFTFE
jgi:cyclohexanone monooxygenase